MTLTVTFVFGRRGRPRYHIRITGEVADPIRGTRRLDTDERVPDEWFEHKGVDPSKRSKRGDTIAASYAAHREQELATDSGALARRRTATIRSIGDLWLDRRAKKDARTLASDRQNIGYLVEFFGDRDPSTIDIGAMEKLRDWLLERDVVARLGTRPVRTLSPRTVYNVCSFGRRLLVWGYARRSETGLSGLAIPAAGPEGIPEIEGREGRGGARRLTIEEFWRVYDAAAGRPRVGAKSQVVLALGLATWLRLEALLNLETAWIDFAAETVTVPAQFMKGGRHELTLPLNRFAMSAIQRALSMNQDSRYLVPVNDRTGRPATNLHHTLRAIAADAGVRPFSLHSIRKTAATILLNHRCPSHPHGVEKIVADRILAHAMPRNDAAYLEVGIEAMRDALGVFDELWMARNRDEDARVVEISARRA